MVIVLDVGSQHTAQMPFVQYDHMIERIAPNAADDPLRIRILPWRLRVYFDLFDAPVLGSLLKMLTVDCIPIPLTNIAVRYPKERPRRSAGPSIAQWDAR